FFEAAQASNILQKHRGADDHAARLVDWCSAWQEIAVAQQSRQLNRVFEPARVERAFARQHMAAHALKNGSGRSIDRLERLFRAAFGLDAEQGLRRMIAVL